MVDKLLDNGTITNVRGVCHSKSLYVMNREDQHDGVAEGLLSNEEGCVLSLGESDRLTTHAGLKQKGAMEDDVVVKVTHAQESLDLALGGRLRELSDDFSP